MKINILPNWHSKTYMRFMLSFCVVLILVTVLFSLFFRSTLFRAAERDLKISSQAAVAQSAIYVDQLLSTMDTITNAISSNRDISAYRINSSDINRIKALNALQQQKAFGQLIENIFYLPVNDGYFLSAYSSYTPETFFRLFSRGHLTPQALDGFYRQQRMPLTAFSDTISNEVQNNSKSMEVISALYPLPYGGIGKYALLLMDINSEKLQAVLQVNAKDGFVFLLDNQGRPLVFDEALGIVAEQVKEISQHIADGPNTPLVLNQQGYYVFSKTLNHNWQLFCLKPQQIVIRTVNAQQAQYIFMFLSVLGIGFSISLVLSIWNYHPIAALSHKVKPLADVQAVQSFSDEIKDIERGLSDIVSRNDDLTSRLESNQQAIYARYVFNLINNRLTPDDLPRIANDGIQLRHSYYVIALFSPRHGMPIRQAGGWIAQLSAAVPRDWDAYFLEYQASRLCVSLISLPLMPQDKLRDAMLLIRQVLPAPVDIGISTPTNDLFNLAPAFIQAQANLEQRFFLGDQHVFVSSDVTEPATAFNYPHARLQKLEFALVSKQEQRCHEELSQLFNTIREAHITMETLYCICFEIVNLIIRQLETNRVPLKHIEILLPNILQVTHNETLDEMEDLIGEALESALEAVNTASEAPHTAAPTFQSIVEYIDQNGYQSDFSVRMVAEHFQISSPYLNKLFREATETTVNKYVQSKRITQAKHLLVNTDLNLTKIVEEVGYIDLSSFIKRFKQETGMTPIAYRKLYR